MTKGRATRTPPRPTAPGNDVARKNGVKYVIIKHVRQDVSRQHRRVMLAAAMTLETKGISPNVHQQGEEHPVRRDDEYGVC